MSVINQMLKDLDQRQVEQQGTGNMAVPVALPSSNKKALFISIIVIILLNVLGLFVWQIYAENQALKQTNNPARQHIEKQAAQKIVTTIESTITSKPGVELINKTIAVKNFTMNKSVQEPEKKDRFEATAQVIEPKHIPTKATVAKLNTPTLADTSVKNLNDIHLPAEQVQTPIKKSSLKISRKQLTPIELAKQNIQRAEQALANKNIVKAEHLFEDVLLVLPEHKSARKQLAALWFGRKSYTAALNLLSQGMAIAPNHREFRLMQARIYLQQNRIGKAFVSLNTLPKVNEAIDVEYQSLRATTAQQSKEFSSAVKAYQILVNLEPSVGRWWLGLGVAHDSNSEFEPASTAYQTALSKTGLSDSAENFVRQRIIELGE